MLPCSIRDPALALFAPRLRDTLWAGLAIVVSVIRGIVPLALRELFAAERHPGWQGRYRTAARLALISRSLLLVFGSLLRSADPIFERLVALPDFDVGLVISHVFVAGFFAWTAGGWAYGALVASPARWRAPDRSPISLGALDLTAPRHAHRAFGAYVLTQLGWFFGGERFLRETRADRRRVRAARPSRWWPSSLVVPLLLATRAMLRPDAALERRHALLSLPVVALLGAIIVSAALHRLCDALLRTDHRSVVHPRVPGSWRRCWRCSPSPCCAAAAVCSSRAPLGARAARGVTRRRPRPGRGARRHPARAHGPRGTEPALDLRHLANLSGEAAALATASVLKAAPGAFVTPVEWNEQRCDASSSLLEHWGPASHTVQRRSRDGAWRWWNAGESEAVRVVGANAPALRRVRHEACAPRWAARRASPAGQSR